MPEDVDWLSLDPDETLVWHGTPRLMVVVKTAAAALVVPVALIAALRSLPGVALGLLVWLAVVGAAWTYVQNREYVVSTSNVYTKQGVFSRSVRQVGLRNVQETSLRQGPFGTLFDHGTIGFSSAGSSGQQVQFREIDDPLAVKRLVDGELSRFRGGASDRSAPASAEASSETSSRSADREAARTVDALVAEAGSMRAAAESLRDSLARDSPTDSTNGGDRP